MNKRIIRELERIQRSIPPELTQELVTLEYSTPVARDMANKALAGEGKFTKSFLQKVKHVVDAGYLDEKEMKVNEEKEKKLHEWVDAEIEKSIKAGRLPDPKTDLSIKKYMKKIWRNTKRTISSDLSKESETLSSKPS